MTSDLPKLRKHMIIRTRYLWRGRLGSQARLAPHPFNSSASLSSCPAPPIRGSDSPVSGIRLRRSRTSDSSLSMVTRLFVSLCQRLDAVNEELYRN